MDFIPLLFRKDRTEDEKEDSVALLSPHEAGESQRKPRSSTSWITWNKRFFLFIAGISTFAVWFYISVNRIEYFSPLMKSRNLYGMFSKPEGVQICKIPQINPWDPLIRPYVNLPEPFSCPSPPPLTRLEFIASSATLPPQEIQSETTTTTSLPVVTTSISSSSISTSTTASPSTPSTSTLSTTPTSTTILTSSSVSTSTTDSTSTSSTTPTSTTILTSSTVSTSTTSSLSTISVSKRSTDSTSSPRFVNIDPYLLSKYGDVKDGVIKCCASTVTRGEVLSKEDTGADWRYKMHDCKPFNISVEVVSDFTFIECKRGDKKVYTDIHATIVPTNVTLKKIKDARRPFPPSILILGIDSSSRLNIHRVAPKFVEALKDTGAVELTSYNKVGENTFPNLLPILTGVSLPEAEGTVNATRTVRGYHCWHNSSCTFDNCPFIWKNFSEKGYVTMFAEDEPSLATFNYIKKGFRDQPTDHYLRPYFVVAEEKLNLTDNVCFANQFSLTRMLNYYRSFVDTYLGKAPFFSFMFVTGIGHSDANKIGRGDAELAEFVRYVVKKSDEELRKGGSGLYFSVFSDHGMRWGSLRSSPFGWLEETLPFNFIRPPLSPNSLKLSPSFAVESEYPNLVKNANRLSSPFDFHFTLYALLNGKGKHPLDSTCEKCCDLLHDLIPLSRTCPDAAVPDVWCACELNDTNVVDKEIAQNASSAAVGYINTLLQENHQCSQLTINSTLNSHYRVLPEGNTEKKLRLLVVSFSTIPGDAIFEATVMKSEKEYKVSSDISRINKYGNQSWCIDDAFKKPYCYCLKQ